VTDTPLAERLTSMTAALVAAGVPRDKSERAVRRELGLDAPATAAPAVQRVGRQPKRMNRTEARRAAELEAMRRAGEIQSWTFEGITLKLADDCRYTPDFFVRAADGTIRCEETKGFWRDDARAKIKMAARVFPMFHFVALTVRKKRDGGGWQREEFAWQSGPPILP
jgi:hypothetical protein